MDGTFTSSSTETSSGADESGGSYNTKTTSSSSKKQARNAAVVRSVSKDNEEVLLSQNRQLAEEYRKGVWAHETSTVRAPVLAVVSDVGPSGAATTFSF
jgi:hypothetical protein